MNTSELALKAKVFLFSIASIRQNEKKINKLKMNIIFGEENGKTLNIIK